MGCKDEQWMQENKYRKILQIFQHKRWNKNGKYDKLKYKAKKKNSYVALTPTDILKIGSVDFSN